MNQRIETQLNSLHRAPRCGAKTRAGTPCKCPAMRGRKRCRLHGGLSPGAPRGQRNVNFRDGHWTAEAIAERRWLRSLVREFGTKGSPE
ncbi:MAG: HGGxSTG domain-containing protein [Rhodoplanes sp.]